MFSSLLENQNIQKDRDYLPYQKPKDGCGCDCCRGCRDNDWCTCGCGCCGNDQS